ncbi:MAG: hypothetical protein JWP01_1746 [Myxococcales bacterium]|nr:hypothetical protein [Myxococcales bacterium]
MLQARSIAEARLFMSLEPCACGHRGFEHPSKIVAHGERLAAVASGYCESCGTMRSFELMLADARVPDGAWGNAEPSTLIDAGGWLALADHFGAQVPASIERLDRDVRDQARANLQRGIAAVGEILKFFPAGAAEPPRSAFFTPRGLEIYVADRRRFTRDRLQVLIEAWRELADSFVEN